VWSLSECDVAVELNAESRAGAILISRHEAKREFSRLVLSMETTVRQLRKEIA
jgi:hypothetical protein